MTQIRNFEEAEAVLARYIPLTREITGRDIQVERMKLLMNALGNPQAELKIVHIAGTSGKTSTAYYIAALLAKAGKKTGLTVSPHVDSVAERLQINSHVLEEKEFCNALGELVDIVTDAKIEPTYFELIIAFAYWYFKKIAVDYAVIETGLGGLHDATNVAQQADKVCVITDIGYDHMHVLGKTLPKIAAQKAGIIHEGNEVLMYKQADEVMKPFELRCMQNNARLHTFEQNKLDGKFSAILPAFQQRNWLLAHEVYTFIQKRDGLRQLTESELEETLHTKVPGRMDRHEINNKVIIMDGAHNEQKMRALVSSFQKLFPGQKATVLLGMKEGKEHADVLSLLKSIAAELIISEFTGMQDTPIVSTDSAVLAEKAKEIGIEHVRVERNVNKAYRLLLESTGSIGLITGSFYLIGELRHTHKELM